MPQYQLDRRAVNMANILVIGGGGREHAICWKLSESDRVSRIFALPGSVGIATVNKVEIVSKVPLLDGFQDVVDFCKNNNVQSVFVGPEDPLANGIGDALTEKGIFCFGPTRAGARIEADKSWSKEFMVKHGIPTAKYQSFTDAEEAVKYIETADHDALVVKASGLAAGKGVIVAADKQEAIAAVREMLVDKKFGAAGSRIVVEELIAGEEISVLAFVDGESVAVMPPAQDHKRLKDYDQGLNTGGMGAYCPCPLITEQQMEMVKKEVLQRAVDGLKKEGISYCGILYAGMMLTKDGPKTLEFNCRFGDPETQVILPLLNTDLFEIVTACRDRKLNQLAIDWNTNLKAVGVIMASKGYPETSTKGCVIAGLNSVPSDSLIFHSGVAKNAAGEYVSNGGRVLIAVSRDTCLETAANMATRICSNTITFEGAQYRKDIAHKALKKSRRDFIEDIKPIMAKSFRTGIMSESRAIRLNEWPQRDTNGEKSSYKDPVLVQGVDGVGTKLKIAEYLDNYKTIGIDLVAMCVNDVLCVGAEPVAFLDYIACGAIQAKRGVEIVQGVVDGCVESGCALVGGDTVEVPELYCPGKYDLAGYCLGIVEHSQILPKMDKMKVGDCLVALPSSGVHSNGFSLINKIMKEMNLRFDMQAKFGDELKTIGDAFLVPTRLYAEPLLPVLRRGTVKGLAHITGGGLTENIPRMLPDHLSAAIDADYFEIPKVFGWIAAQASLSEYEMLKTYNCGIGMLVVLPEGDKTSVEMLKRHGGSVVGRLVENTGHRVIVKNFQLKLEKLKADFGVTNPVQLTYKQSGVDITAGDDLVQRIKPFAKATAIPGCIGGLGSFGGLYRLQNEAHSYVDPVLVLKTGTVRGKLMLADASVIGKDLVTDCLNRICSRGAVPLTYLDYYACGKLDVNVAASVVQGMAEECMEGGCVLLGGETAEMPGMYQEGQFDLAGFGLGVVEYNQFIGKGGEEKEILIGIPSTGLHTEGFSKLMHLLDAKELKDTSFGLTTTPSRNYTKALAEVRNNMENLIARIVVTGEEGLEAAVKKTLSEDEKFRFNSEEFEIHPLYHKLRTKMDRISEMAQNFNMGIGMIVAAKKENEEAVLDLLLGLDPRVIGSISKREPNESQFCYKTLQEQLHRPRAIPNIRRRVGVMISGSGTNLQSLIDKSLDRSYGMNVEIVCVISNKSDVLGLLRAKNHNIPTHCVAHKSFPTRVDFDAEVSRVLESHNVEIVCLAGFMRVLSEEFVRKWQGRLINVHPSLLPKHRGINAQQQTLQSGDPRGGCSIHFVDEDVDTGAIILQISVPVQKDDTLESLSARILKAEHTAFPKALKWLATGRIQLDVAAKAVKFN